MQGVLLDVRTPDEDNKGHLKGSENVDFLDSGFAASLAERPKETTYFIYCHSGGRSGKALAKMKEAGFKRVYHMKGGITAWKARRDACCAVTPRGAS